MYELKIDLDATSWLFEAGHRIRLSVSQRRLPEHLALADAGDEPAAPRGGAAVATDAAGGRSPPDAVAGAGLRAVAVSARRRAPPTPQSWRVTRDQMRGRTEVAIEGAGTSTIDQGYVRESSYAATASVDERDPARAWMRGQQVDGIVGPGRRSRCAATGRSSVRNRRSPSLSRRDHRRRCPISNGDGRRAFRGTCFDARGRRHARRAGR